MATTIFLLSFLLACATAVPHELAAERSLKNRITNGDTAKEGEFPYLVALQLKPKDFDVSVPFCGGSIINEQWILTAAHCAVMVTDEDTVMATAGKHNILLTEKYEQDIEVEKAIIHEKMKDCSATECTPGPYDLALLKLKKPLKLNKRVASIKLPKKGSKPTGKLTISGWGSVSRTPALRIPVDLQRADVKLMDLKTCDSIFKLLTGKPSKLHPTNLCTGPLEKEANVCKGDSGGPLAAVNEDGENEIVGVTSWGLFPCLRKLPSVFVKVSDFVDWIESTMANNS